MVSSIQQRFKVGDEVFDLSTSDEFNVGTIEDISCLDVVVMSGEIDVVTHACVKFTDCSRFIPLNKLVSKTQIELYESLCIGDLVVYGKKKYACGIVIDIVKKKSKRRSITKHTVYVLEGGVKKQLQYLTKIISVCSIQ